MRLMQRSASRLLFPRASRRVGVYKLGSSLQTDASRPSDRIYAPHNLERVLRVFVHHYNGHRPHRALDLKPPDPMRPTLRLAGSSGPDHVERRDRLGGLIHEYGFAA